VDISSSFPRVFIGFLNVLLSTIDFLSLSSAIVFYALKTYLLNSYQLKIFGERA